MSKSAMFFAFSISILGVLSPLKSSCEFDAFDNEKVKPNALAQSYTLSNEKSQILFNTDYFAPCYFSNLKDRFGNNIKNSCTYVAIDRLPSYYDSFWDDGFLPERYNGEVVSVSETVINAKISPGSKIDSSI